MATRTCPDCGAQYVATVRRCIDCDVMLVDEAPPEVDGEPGSPGAPVGAGDQIGYELDGWGNQLKVTLEGMLARAGIGRVWEAGALVVSVADEDAVDELIATLEGGDIDELDDDAPKVALEIEGLDAEGHDDLDARLLADGIAHAWDEEGALVVAETDEERVLVLVGDALDHEGGGDDGLAAQDKLSAAYVTVDRLVKHPDDPKLGDAFAVAARELAGLAVPYGFSADDWSELVGQAEALADLVAPATEPDHGPADEADEDVEVEAEVGDHEVGLDEGADEDDDQDATDADEGEPADEADEADEADDPALVLDEDAARSAARALRSRLVDLV